MLPVGLFFYHPNEDIIRRAGLVLQLLGIGTVWLGIEETRKLFRHPPFREQAYQWVRQRWQDRPRFPGGVTIEPGVSRSTVSGGRPVVLVGTNASPDATVEQRLKSLEKNLTRVRQDLAKLQDTTDDQFTKQTEALKQERQSRATAEHELRELLTATETGGLHITMAGAIFLFFGVIMSTVPAELAVCVFKPLNNFLLR